MVHPPLRNSVHTIATSILPGNSGVVLYSSILPDVDRQTSFQKVPDGMISTNQTTELDLFHQTSSGSTLCDFICHNPTPPFRVPFALGSRICRMSIATRSRGVCFRAAREMGQTAASRTYIVASVAPVDKGTRHKTPQ